MKCLVSILLVCVAISSCSILPKRNDDGYVEIKYGNKTIVLDGEFTEEEMATYVAWYNYFNPQPPPPSPNDPTPTPDPGNPPDTGNLDMDIPGRVVVNDGPRTVLARPDKEYKWVGENRYAKHVEGSKVKWLSVDDNANYTPLSDRDLFKHDAQGGLSAYLVGNSEQTVIDKVLINGKETSRRSNDTNGGRTHFYFPRFTGPVEVRKVYNDGRPDQVYALPKGNRSYQEGGGGGRDDLNNYLVR